MKTKLVHEIRRGLLVVRIRRATTRDTICHMLSLHRLYKNGELWHESTRFGSDDIPFVRFLLDEAHNWMIEQESGFSMGVEVGE